MNTRRSLIISSIVVIVLILIGAVWYVLGHKSESQSPTATSTNPFASSTTTQPVESVPAQHISESAQYYSVDMQYPSQTPLVSVSPEANTNAIAVMKAFAQSSRDTFVDQGDLSSDWVKDYAANGGSLEISDSYKLYTGAHTISYVYDVYSDTGGAHPNTYFKNFTFDSSTGAQLKLADLFVANADYLGKISTLSRAQLTATQDSTDDSAATTILEGTEPTEDNFQNFSIDGGYLVILFDPYQVASYAEGPKTVRIPLTQLSSILQPAYR